VKSLSKQQLHIRSKVEVEVFNHFCELLGYCENCKTSRFVYPDLDLQAQKSPDIKYCCALCFGSDREIRKLFGDWVPRPKYLFGWLGDCFYREDRRVRAQEGYCDLYDIGNCTQYCRDFIPLNPRIPKIIQSPWRDKLRDRISRFQQARLNLILLNYYPAPDPTF